MHYLYFNGGRAQEETDPLPFCHNASESDKASAAAVPSADEVEC